MAVHFHPLKIKNIVRETPDSVIISFDVPEALQQVFKFTQGQNLTLKSTINSGEFRRSYSICSAPHENSLSVAIRKNEYGKFSTYANEYLKKGDVIDVLPPTGRFFTPLEKSNKKSYLAIAAGSGITPIISIIKATLLTEPASEFTLVYGNRTRNSIMFFEELEGLKNKYISRFNIVHILSREQTEAQINYGRIDQHKLSALTKLLRLKRFDEVFICGPEAMLFTVKEYLELQGFPKKNIHFELFTAPGKKATEISQIVDKRNQESKSNITIKLDGHYFKFPLENSNDSILDAALKQGADLPFACKGGVCSTCRAKLIEGQVYMDNNYALEPEEIEQGFILTCQSHPTTESVIIDFDNR